MRAPRSWPLYLHTLRHLKVSQVWFRLAQKVWKPKPNLREQPETRPMCGAWHVPAHRRRSVVSKTRFRFLNTTHEIPKASDWNNPDLPKLWLYNLHYFDDLNSDSAQNRTDIHRSVIERWIAENPPAKGVGWEPYPTSIRIVNLIKWSCSGNALDGSIQHSLSVQLRCLLRRLEKHLLGNHLLANAKALVFGGLYFYGREADTWLKTGLRILETEIPEQILTDGGHFERSTMYHALVYEDVLDLINICGAYSGPDQALKSTVLAWRQTALRMERWLRSMCHPDGEISFFNDAAFGIAPTPASLFAYARRLGLQTPEDSENPTLLTPSGYVRCVTDYAVLIIDVAPLGPDYLPGHAHADTLSFELSLFGQRVFVNSGTSCYGFGPEREWQRGTAAHNTVTVNGQSSSEMWKGFRVGRRARPHLMGVRSSENVVSVSASHSGYKRLESGIVHARTWDCGNESIVIEDKISGRYHEAIARFYLHPDIQVQGLPKSAGAILILPAGQRIGIEVEGGALALSDSRWYPEFGRAENSQCIIVRFAQAVVRTTVRVQH